MPVEILLHALVGLLPVLGFLAALVYLDSYKLVTLRAVVAVVACGVAMAVAGYFVNGLTLGLMPIELASFSRYVAPVAEELLKGLVIVALIRAHRIGFLVDAAIFGFAVGTGFALVENLYYQHQVPDAGIGTWIVRGFGTAIMHGGATAIFAMLSLVILERNERRAPAAFLPGFVLAVVLHSAYNHMFVSPRFSTLTVLVVLPLLMLVVFRRSETALGDWLGRGFDAATEMLKAINSGHFTDSPAGKYLGSLKDRFKGPVVADLLCYLRLHTELALRAKGILMMRENGFHIPPDEATRAKFAELHYLERSIGKTGLLALKPMLNESSKDLWQLHMLEE